MSIPLLMHASAITMVRQSVVAGSVKSSKGGFLVVGVTVAFRDSEIVTITDKNGSFRGQVPYLTGAINLTYAGMFPFSGPFNK